MGFVICILAVAAVVFAIVRFAPAGDPRLPGRRCLALPLQSGRPTPCRGTAPFRLAKAHRTLPAA